MTWVVFILIFLLVWKFFWYKHDFQDETDLKRIKKYHGAYRFLIFFYGFQNGVPMKSPAFWKIFWPKVDQVARARLRGEHLQPRSHEEGHDHNLLLEECRTNWKTNRWQGGYSGLPTCFVGVKMWCWANPTCIKYRHFGVTGIRKRGWKWKRKKAQMEVCNFRKDRTDPLWNNINNIRSHMLTTNMFKQRSCQTTEVVPPDKPFLGFLKLLVDFLEKVMATIKDPGAKFGRNAPKTFCVPGCETCNIVL